MHEETKPRVAIVDYGMGNLFSVKHACEHEGLHASITSSRQEILNADAVILPGVGAFGDAMARLMRLELVNTLQAVAGSAKPLMGICLGMQLLMAESLEFGRHAGLNIIPGKVVRFENPPDPNVVLKVPHVSWNHLYRSKTAADPWRGSLLDGLQSGVFMYFVHSFYVKPEDEKVVIATTWYGNTEFCSALSYRNIFACQCHPERSGTRGLEIYRNLALLLSKKKQAIRRHEYD
jgi:imidazole glycerol-phosphate synthase subunit HisH